MLVDRLIIQIISSSITSEGWVLLIKMTVVDSYAVMDVCLSFVIEYCEKYL